MSGSFPNPGVSSWDQEVRGSSWDQGPFMEERGVDNRALMDPAGESLGHIPVVVPVVRDKELSTALARALVLSPRVGGLTVPPNSVVED